MLQPQVIALLLQALVQVYAVLNNFSLVLRAEQSQHPRPIFAGTIRHITLVNYNNITPPPLDQVVGDRVPNHTRTGYHNLNREDYLLILINFKISILKEKQVRLCFSVQLSQDWIVLIG